MAALERMRPRDHGTIVQVGSALGQRSIPLQSAYCGAKHAVNGFTSSLRCELMHEGSGVQVTVVQMPAVNTPQFSWVRSRLPRHPQPVPPIYQPEVAARAVLFAAGHPGRKQYWVGMSTTATLLAEKFASRLLDRYLARTGYDSQQTGEHVAPGRPDNLMEPADGPGGRDYGPHGVFGDKSHPRSAQEWLSQHARLTPPGRWRASRRARWRPAGGQPPAAGPGDRPGLAGGRERLAAAGPAGLRVPRRRRAGRADRPGRRDRLAVRAPLGQPAGVRRAARRRAAGTRSRPPIPGTSGAATTSPAP